MPKQQPQTKTVFDKVKENFHKASNKYGISPYHITSSQFWSVSKNISEWDIRKLGGLSNLKAALFPEYFSVKSKKDKGRKVAKIPRLEGFVVHETPIKEVFRMCGLSKNDVLKVVVQPDTHTPQHDKKAVDTFCRFLDYYRPHGLINLGDFMEMESVSHWDQMTPEARRFVPEAKVARQVLGDIEDAAGSQCKYKRFIMGNHEFWLQDYLVKRVPEVLDGLEDLGIDLSLGNLLGLDDYGYEVIPFNEILKLGHAHYIHGWYTGSHHAAKHLKVTNVNTYFGHVHDVQSHSDVSVRGLHEAMSLGCLRSMDAKFLKGKPNNWSHAFGVFEFFIDGSYSRVAPIIIDGRLSFNGKVFVSKL